MYHTLDFGLPNIETPVRVNKTGQSAWFNNNDHEHWRATRDSVGSSTVQKFSIYTNDCRSTKGNTHIIKYADDTAIEDHIKTQSDLENYESEISLFVDWCDHHHLQLNVRKTKEIIFDFRKGSNSKEHQIDIKNEKVEIVSNYKYLGVVFDEKLEWSGQSAKICQGMNKRMYFMRQLYSIDLDTKLLTMFFKSFILTVLNFCLPVWGGNAKELDKRKINRWLKHACKMLNRTHLLQFDDICKKN